MRSGHKKAPVSDCLAAVEAGALIIGGEASDKNFDSTVTAARATGLDFYAVQIIAARYQLSHPVAQCVAELAAIGGVV